MPGDVETVVRYPTYYLRPNRSSRIVREVVYKELQRLAEYDRVSDVLKTARSVYSMYRTYRQLDYSIPEFLSAYQGVDVRDQMKPTVESIPWDILPVDILERALDENMELSVTDEVLEYLGFKKSDSVFDKYDYPSRYVKPEDRDKLIVSPRYSDDGKKVLSREYLMYDEELGDYRKALIRKPGTFYTNKTKEEVSYVVEMFNKDNTRTSLGIKPSLLASTIWSIIQCLQEYRKDYFGKSYIERLAQKSVEELRKERLINEQEYAVSRRGTYQEDTSVLWRYGQFSD